MKIQSSLEIAADHPAFAGHFPGFPVVPGALLLDEMLKVIEEARGIDLRRIAIADGYVGRRDCRPVAGIIGQLISGFRGAEER